MKRILNVSSSTKYPNFDAALCRIHRYSPNPTLILNESLRVVQVSDSHCAFSGRSRDEFLGACACDLPPQTIPVPDIPSLYGALRAAIDLAEVQVMRGYNQKERHNISASHNANLRKVDVDLHHVRGS